VHLAKPHFLGAIVAAVLFGCAAVFLFGTNDVESNKPQILQVFEFLGVRSYTIYIAHFPVVALICAGLIQEFGRRPSHGWIGLAGFLLTLVFGCICFELCEKHYLHPKVVIALNRE
jgi:peptidoglycan/LPS O-acetylase OafA/YrhL